MYTIVQIPELGTVQIDVPLSTTHYAVLPNGTLALGLKLIDESEDSDKGPAFRLKAAGAAIVHAIERSALRAGRFGEPSGTPPRKLVRFLKPVRVSALPASVREALRALESNGGPMLLDTELATTLAKAGSGGKPEDANG